MPRQLLYVQSAVSRNRRRSVRVALDPQRRPRRQSRRSGRPRSGSEAVEASARRSRRRSGSDRGSPARCRPAPVPSRRHLGEHRRRGRRDPRPPGMTSTVPVTRRPRSGCDRSITQPVVDVDAAPEAQRLAPARGPEPPPGPAASARPCAIMTADPHDAPGGRGRDAVLELAERDLDPEVARARSAPTCRSSS